jgi:hypothetical protein
MNAKQKKEIERISGELNSLMEDIQTIADEEKEKFDALSEKAQKGERGQGMESLASALQDAVDNLSSVIETVDSVE